MTLFVLARYDGGIPTVEEPDKCSEWKRFEWDELPSPLFAPIVNLKGGGFRVER